MADSHCDHCAELADHYRQELGRAEAELAECRQRTEEIPLLETLFRKRHQMWQEMSANAGKAWRMWNESQAELERLRAGIRELIAVWPQNRRFNLERLLEKPDA